MPPPLVWEINKLSVLFFQSTQPDQLEKNLGICGCGCRRRLVNAADILFLPFKCSSLFLFSFPLLWPFTVHMARVSLSLADHQWGSNATYNSWKLGLQPSWKHCVRGNCWTTGRAPDPILETWGHQPLLTMAWYGMVGWGHQRLLTTHRVSWEMASLKGESSQ